MKILVRGTNWIGDAVMSIPAMRELRRIFPDAEISLHTRTWAEGIFRDATFIDDLITYDKSRWVFRDILDNARFLRRDSFDIVVVFPNSFESALTSKLASIPLRIGYNKDARGLLLSDPIAVPEWKGRRHEAFYYLNLVGELEKRVLGTRTVFEAEPDATIDIDSTRVDEARSKLTSLGADLSRKTVVLAVGSTNSMAKRWPHERFAAVGETLRSLCGANLILMGSAAEKDVAAQTSQLMASGVIDLSGQTTIDEAVAILAAADLLISNDMGLAHVAPSVGTETIVIFGPTDPVTTSPFGRNAHIISKDVECAPCMLRKCPIDHRCMTRVSVDEVAALASQILLPVEPEYE